MKGLLAYFREKRAGKQEDATLRSSMRDEITESVRTTERIETQLDRLLGDTLRSLPNLRRSDPPKAIECLAYTLKKHKPSEEEVTGFADAIKPLIISYCEGAENPQLDGSPRGFLGVAGLLPQIMESTEKDIGKLVEMATVAIEIIKMCREAFGHDYIDRVTALFYDRDSAKGECLIKTVEDLRLVKTLVEDYIQHRGDPGPYLDKILPVIIRKAKRPAREDGKDFAEEARSWHDAVLSSYYSFDEYVAIRLRVHDSTWRFGAEVMAIMREAWNRPKPEEEKKK